MNRLYKPILIVLWLLLFGVFTSTILGQTITFNTKTDFTTGTNPLSVSIGDLNGDGLPDLAVANFSSNSISVFANTTTPGASTPSFSTKTDFTTGSEPSSVSIGDLNGDGKPRSGCGESGFCQCFSVF